MSSSDEFVTHVIDGDTFETRNNASRVRLKDVDTPERGEPGFERAKSALERLILHRTVRILTHARDVYGRRIADVWVNGTHVNQAMQPYSK